MPQSVPQSKDRKERRKGPRYRVQLPILFRWGDGDLYTSGGFTRDVSLKAFFVISRDRPPLKTHLRCQILMPASVQIGGNAINTIGRVTRLATHGEGPGFVVKAKLYTSAKSARTNVQ